MINKIDKHSHNFATTAAVMIITVLELSSQVQKSFLRIFKKLSIMDDCNSNEVCAVPDARPPSPPAGWGFRGDLPPSRTPAPDKIWLKVAFTSA